MLKESSIFCRHIGMDKELRKFIIAQLHPPFPRIAMHRRAINAAHIGGQRRFIGFECINRWQIARKHQPNDQPAKQERGKRIGRQPKPAFLPALPPQCDGAAGITAQP